MNFTGLRAVDQNSIVVGQVVGAQIANSLEIQAVRFETVAQINGQRRCVTLRGGAISATNGVIVLPIEQARLFEAN